MAVSFDTWRRAHGFSAADAPDAKELALRLVMQKGMVTPELTEAMLQSVAPEMMGALRQQTMENNGAAIPPEIDDLLTPAGTGAPSTTEDVAEESTQEETTPPPLAEPEA
jgi:hypothetical protein